MKRIVSVLLAVILVAAALCVSTSAIAMSSTAFIQTGTTAHDLNAYGIHNFYSYYVTRAPRADGSIGASEYPAISDVAVIGDGLSLTNGAGTNDYTNVISSGTTTFGDEYKDAKITSYLCYNDQYVFIAEQVELSEPISVTTSSGAESTLHANVRYGLNQSPYLPEAASRLSNTYAYRSVGTNFTVSSVPAGNRTFKQISGEVSQSVTLDFDSYVDSSSNTWDMTRYSKNAASGYRFLNGKHVYMFEYRIPLGDIAYSMKGRYDPSDVAELLAMGKFYGTYLFQLAVTRTGGENGNSQLFLTTGFGGDREMRPYCEYNGVQSNTKSSTWAKEAREFWTLETGEKLSITYVPSPVCHMGAYDPSNPGTVTSTGFRAGLSGYGLDEVQSVYKLGEIASFTVVPDAVENTSPQVGDSRVVPTQFRVRKGYDTKITGTFASDHKTAQFETKNLPVGLHTLVVTFTQQRFDGTGWVDTGTTKNLSRNITIAGTVLGSSGGASQTGDSLTLVLMAGGAMLACVAAITVVSFRRKKVK